MMVNAYVLYSLDWRDGSGQQPYPYVWSQGAQFQGGVSCRDGTYLGYLYGTDEQCAAAISNCKSYFNMQGITSDQALLFYAQAIGNNTTLGGMDGNTLYINGVTLDENGNVTTVISSTPNGWNGTCDWVTLDVPGHINQALTDLKTAGDALLFQHYPVSNLLQLMMMYITALTTNNTAALALLNQVVAWAGQYPVIYYEQAAAVSACTTHAQIATIDWNAALTAWVATDPLVTIAAVNALLNPPPSSSSSSSI